MIPISEYDIAEIPIPFEGESWWSSPVSKLTEVAVSAMCHVGSAIAAIPTSKPVQSLVVAPLLNYCFDEDWKKLARLVPDPALKTYMRDLKSLLAPALTDNLSEALLTHILASLADKIALDELNAGRTLSPNEFLLRAVVHLQKSLQKKFAEAETKARGEGRPGPSVEDFNTLSTQILQDFIPETSTLFKLWKPKQIDEWIYQLYLITKNIPTTDLDELKQTLRVQLWHPEDYRSLFPGRDVPAAIDRSLSVLSGLEANIDHLVSLADGISKFIMSEVQAKAANSDEIREILSKSLPERIVNGTVGPLLHFFLNSDHEMMTAGKAQLQAHVQRLILKGMSNAIATVQAEALAEAPQRLPNTQILTHLFNKAIPMLERTAQPEQRVQACRDLVRLFFPNPHAEFPQTPWVQAKVPEIWEMVDGRLLPNLVGEWIAAFRGCIDEVEANREAVDKAFGTNHATKFCEVVGTIWVRDFIPHILSKKKEVIAQSTFKKWNEKYGTHFDPALNKEPYEWLSASIAHLTSEVHEGTALYKASAWSGVFAEALMLKLFKGIFVPIRQVDARLIHERRGNVAVQIMCSLLPEVTQFYQRVEEIRLGTAGNGCALIDHTRLISGLQGNAEKKNILNPAFPLSDGASPAEKRAQEEHRLSEFTRWAQQILNMGGVSPENAPFPEPLVEIGLNFLKELVLAQTILTITEKGRDPKMIDTMFLKAFKAIKAYKIPSPEELSRADSDPAPSVAPEGLGELIKNLIALVPHAGLFRIVELEEIRGRIGDISEAEVAKLFNKFCQNADLFKFINSQIEMLLPELVENGAVQPVTPNKINFVQKRGVLKLQALFNEVPVADLNMSEEHFNFVRLGAEALATGAENTLKAQLQAFRTWLEGGVDSFVRAHTATCLEPVVGILRVLYKWIVYKIVIPLFVGLFILPYLGGREAIKYLYLRRLVERYREMALAPYHENLLLNLFSGVLNKMNEDTQAARSG